MIDWIAGALFAIFGWVIGAFIQSFYDSWRWKKTFKSLGYDWETLRTKRREIDGFAEKKEKDILVESR